MEAQWKAMIALWAPSLEVVQLWRSIWEGSNPQSKKEPGTKFAFTLQQSSFFPSGTTTAQKSCHEQFSPWGWVSAQVTWATSCCWSTWGIGKWSAEHQFWWGWWTPQNLFLQCLLPTALVQWTNDPARQLSINREGCRGFVSWETCREKRPIIVGWKLKNFARGVAKNKPFFVHQKQNFIREDFTPKIKIKFFSLPRGTPWFVGQSLVLKKPHERHPIAAPMSLRIFCSPNFELKK